MIPDTGQGWLGLTLGCALAAMTMLTQWHLSRLTPERTDGATREEG